MSPRLLLAFALFGLTADPVAALEINTGSVVMTTTADAASVTAGGALKAAGDISATTLEQVQRAMTGAISGVKVVVKQPFK